MEQRVSFITLGVSDVGRSRLFYERMGWRPSGSSVEGEVAFFQVGAMVFALYGREALAKDANSSAEGSGFSGVALAHNVREREEVDAVLLEAEHAGGRILKKGMDTFWGGYAGYFADIDGHTWEVAWNPGFGLADEGGVFLPE
jgi:uncharacterized protein